MKSIVGSLLMTLMVAQCSRYHLVNENKVAQDDSDHVQSECSKSVCFFQ